MGKFRLFSYNPPAKGVKKDDERASVQTDFAGFFIMYGRKFWNISNLNLLMAIYVVFIALGVWQLAPYPLFFYIFLGIAALLFGVVNAGTTYVTRGYTRGDPVYILSDFKYAVKKNWFQATVLGIVDLLIIAVLVFDIMFWSGTDLNFLNSVPENSNDTVIEQRDDAISTGDVEVADNTATEIQPEQKENTFMGGVFFYACVFLLIIYMFMRCYIYLLLVTFKLSIFKILKNAFIFAFLGIKRNILGLLGIFAFAFINIYVFVYIPMVGIMLPLIITLASCSYVGAYAAYPVIKKYMITPYYNEEEVFDSYDSIFVDRG